MTRPTLEEVECEPCLKCGCDPGDCAVFFVLQDAFFCKPCWESGDLTPKRPPADGEEKP